MLDVLTWPDGDDPISLVLAGIGLLILMVVLALLGIPLLVALLELLFLALLIAVALVARVAFRRPWAVQAQADDGTSHWWRVVGWRASGRKIEEVAQHLEAGVDPAAERTTSRT